MTDPIRKSLNVPLQPIEAFDLFTKGINRWWPMDSHSLSAGEDDADRARVHVEPRVGGQVIETRADGSTAPWARVTEWRPGAHLQLHWHVGRAEDEATVLDVRFAAHDGGTRVDLTHGGFDVLGPQAKTVCAGYTSGWDHVLGTCFRAACTKLPA